jgi:hypothetical protein
MLHYEMRIDELERERQKTNTELVQINQMVQSMFSQLKDDLHPKLKKIDIGIRKIEEKEEKRNQVRD